MLVLSHREFAIAEKESTALQLLVEISLVDSNESISLCLLMMSVKLMLGVIGVKSELMMENVPFL